MEKPIWKIWVRTTTEKKAREVFSGLMKRMARQGELVSLEPYEKINGYVLCFCVEMESTTWNDRIIECFMLGQRVASGWALMGNVKDDPGGSSSRVSDSAVESIEWSFR